MRQGCHFSNGIKTSKSKRWKRPTRRRKTLAAQIRELAETDVFAASMLAERGKIFSPVENLVSIYYQTLLKFRKIQSGQKSEMEEITDRFPNLPKWDAARERAAIENTLKNEAAQIAQIVIDAVNSKDADIIFELAKAVEFLRHFKPSGDPVRARILIEKDMAIKFNRRWTISELAKLIDWPERDREHGFPHLRRLCKEFNFPLKPASQTRDK